MNEPGLAHPTSAQTSTTRIDVAPMSLFASLIRSAVRNTPGLTPVVSLNTREKWKGLSRAFRA